jgi:hypothetical protein
MNLLTNAWNAGELTPELAGRYDLEKLRKGARLLRNAVPRPLGGTRRRPGMMHLGPAKFPDRRARLIPFAASAADRYMLELGHQYLRVWKNGTRLDVELAAPWAEEQVATVQFTQVNDLVFFVHPELPVHELRRITDASWTFAPFAWRWPATRDENVTSLTMRVQPAAGATPAQLIASANWFTAGDVGAYYQITHARETTSTPLSLMAHGQTDGALQILGAWDLYTTGIWAGTLYLETLDEDNQWQVLRSWSGAQDRNVTANGRFERLTKVRLRYTGTGSPSGSPSANPRAILEPTDVELHGLVRVDSVTSATQCAVTVISEPFASTATARWREGAWSVRRGYPSAIALHQQRLTFAGTAAQPQTIWGSAINDWNNFQTIDAEDAAYSVTIAAQEANPIAWMASVDGLIVGTEGDEWLLDAAGGVITQANPPVAKRKTGFGSARQQAQLVGSVVLFVQRGGRKVREYVYAFEESNYKALDLTELADHMTVSGGITQLAFASAPDPTIWGATSDGRLLSCTYLRDAEVIAWAQHSTDGLVESVAVLPGEDIADEVWMIVQRTTDAGPTRRVERFDPDHWVKMQAGTTPTLSHLDGATIQTSATPTATWGNLAHLEGREVAVWADGAVQPARRVVAGSIALQLAASTLIVGLPYTSTLQPYTFDVVTQTGTSAGRKWRTAEMRLILWQTGPMEYADGPEGPWYPIKTRSGDDLMDEAPPLFTGKTDELAFQSNHRDNLDVTLRTSGPGPMNVLAIATQTTAYD